jgi:hypothetical protein
MTPPILSATFAPDSRSDFVRISLDGYIVSRRAGERETIKRTIVEERTRNVTPVNQFTRWRVEAFPSPPQRFSVAEIP